MIIYAGRELGAFGFTEKPWYQPHQRLQPFLDELERRSLMGPGGVFSSHPLLEQYHMKPVVRDARLTEVLFGSGLPRNAIGIALTQSGGRLTHGGVFGFGNRPMHVPQTAPRGLIQG